AELKQIIDGTTVQFSDSFEIDGQEMYQHACKLGLEGVVSKVRESAYVSGRSNIWVKKTCQQRETLTIAGFAWTVRSGTASIWAAARARTSSMPARSTTASIRSRPRTYASV